MKTIEQKARAYDEALEKAKEVKNNPFAGYDGTDLISALFPELKESEDERIRKELLDFCKNRAENYPNDPKYKNISAWIAWLEKQGDANKEYWRGYREGKQEILDKYAELEKQGEQKPADKIEPKFKVGDKIQFSKGCGIIMTIEKIENGEYIFGNNLGHTTIENGNKWHLVERNPTWSEEDEKFIHGLIRGLAAKRDIHGHTTFSSDCIDITETINWLKSLRPQNHWKPSDEQMLAINTAINVIGKGTLNGRQLIKLREELQKLREDKL